MSLFLYLVIALQSLGYLTIGEIYLALFNLNRKRTTISAQISDIGKALLIDGLGSATCKYKEVWSSTDLGTVTRTISYTVRVHGAALFVLHCPLAPANEKSHAWKHVAPQDAGIWSRSMLFLCSVRVEHGWMGSRAAFSPPLSTLFIYWWKSNRLDSSVLLITLACPLWWINQLNLALWYLQLWNNQTPKVCP